MTSDVRTLIGALTTERDSLTRAIDALRQIGQPSREVAAPIERTPRRAKAKRSMRAVPADVRALIVSGMAQAEKRRQVHEAQRLAVATGIRVSTILSGWRRWQGQGVNNVPANGATSEPFVSLQ